MAARGQPAAGGGAFISAGDTDPALRKHMSSLFHSLGQTQKALTARVQAAQTPAELFDPETSTLRERIRDTCTTIITESLAYAVEHNVHTNLWKYCVYLVIDAYRKLSRKTSADRTSAAALGGSLQSSQTGSPPADDSELLLAAFLCGSRGCIDWLLEEVAHQHRVVLNPEAESAPWEGPRERLSAAAKAMIGPATDLCHKLAMFAGDIARYEVLLLPPAVHAGAWECALAYYRTALRLKSGEGQPYNQIAVLYGSASDGGLDATYFYIRSLGSPNPSPMTAQNLRVMLKKISEDARGLAEPRVPTDDPDALLRNRAMITAYCAAHFLKMHNTLLHMLRMDAFEDLCMGVSRALEQMLALTHYDLRHALSRGSLDTMLSADDISFSHCSVPLLQRLLGITLYSYHVQQVSTDRRREDYSALAVFASLRFLAQLLNWCALVVVEGAHHGHAAPPLALYLAPARIALLFLLSSAFAAELEVRAATRGVQDLWKAVALVLNTAIDLADIDVVSPPLDGTAEAADLEPLPEDRDFLGFAPLRDVLRDETRRGLDMRLAPGTSEHRQRCESLVTLGRILSDKHPSQLYLDLGKKHFVTSTGHAPTAKVPAAEYHLPAAAALAWGGVPSSGDPFASLAAATVPLPSQAAAMREDDPAAQTEQRQRVMRAMAQQRLESEVATLERSLQQTPAGSVAAPYIVPDTLTLVSHLPAFRKLLAAKRAVLVISSGVMADLDFLKSGDEDVNRNAREAARLLEKAINEHDPCVVIEARQEAGALSLDADAEVADLGSADRRILACAVALSLKQQHSDMVALLTTNALLETAARNRGLEVVSASDYFAHFQQGPPGGSAKRAKRRHKR